VAQQVELRLALQPKQLQAFLSPATEILYGGAAFGGKSYLERVAAISWCYEIPGLNVYIFRRVEDDLIKNHMEGPHGFRNMLAPWVNAGLARIVETEIRFWNGSKIFLCHCKDEAHRFKYHGAEIHVLIVDELTTFTEVIYRYLRFRTRMVGIKRDPGTGKYLDSYPVKYRKGEIGPHGKVNEWDWFPRVLCGSNPGNIGHAWVKRSFVDAMRSFQIWKTPDTEGAMQRQFIPALMQDNPIGMAEDPEYVTRTRGLLDPNLVKAMEAGDWNVLAGGFFPEFSRGRHVIKPLELPAEWSRFTMSDWGSAKPFWTGWGAVAQDDMRSTTSVGSPITIPRGSIIVYREWYGWDGKQRNVGVKIPATKWARGVIIRSSKETIDYDVVDASMFDEDGGPSLAEAASKVRHGPRKLNLRPADKRRLPGWDQIRMRLHGDEGDDRPLIYIFETCPELITTLESLQHDELKPEDADTDGEDHPPDGLRYGCMSRPRRKLEPRPEETGPKPGTIPWLEQQGWKGKPWKRPSYNIDRG